MKVKIGPYKRWIGPYQITDMLFFWVNRKGIFPDDDPRWNRWDYKAADWLGERLADSWVCSVCNWFHNKTKRNVKVHIDYYDTWSMDHTLALIIHPMLLQLKATKHGSPFVDDEDVPENLRSAAAPELTDEQKNYGETDALFHERWSYVLDEMIYAFALEIDDDWEEEYYARKDHEGITVIADRQKNGFRLFGKYYQGLWD